nr:hypothetical protein 6 [bacterium]
MERFKSFADKLLGEIKREMTQEQKGMWHAQFILAARKVARPKDLIIFLDAIHCNEIEEINKTLNMHKRSSVSKDTVVERSQNVLYAALDEVGVDWMEKNGTH